MNDIIYREHFLTLHRRFYRYNFAISEIEYYFVERIAIDENEEG